MKQTIKVKYHDNVFIEIDSEDKKIHDEISEQFSFPVKNAKFMRRAMGFHWDGKIRVYKKRPRLLPFGMIRVLKGWALLNDYELDIDPRISSSNQQATDQEIETHVKSLASTFTARDYQMASIKEAIRRKRIVVESPTSSGKSFVIYAVARYIEKLMKPGEKILIVVPTVTLLHQLPDNFKEYGFTGSVHSIEAGVAKNAFPTIYVSTFQSLFRALERRVKLDRRKKDKPVKHKDRRVKARRVRVEYRDPNYFKQFRAIMIDEAHGIKAATDARVLNEICEACTEADWRVALSGTFSDESVDQRVVEGYFGAFHSVITTDELIKQGHASKFQIKAIKIRYPADITRQLDRLDYHVQQEFQEAIDNPRQAYIAWLVNSLPNNTIVLFHLLEHGKFLYDMLQYHNKNCRYIDGDTPGSERMEIFREMEQDSNMTLVASFQVCSAGVNVKNLHNVVFAASYKSKIRILQSIGRTLRLHRDKAIATLYDLIDMYKYPLDHYAERLGHYDREKFSVEESEIDIMEWQEKNPEAFQSFNHFLNHPEHRTT